ncbi:MAG TPA: XTP/dITP diphosphatase [Tissierellaceae bacterium]|nr:XTP/dITP diphosphatase [Tissierellaceae bacterium]
MGQKYLVLSTNNMHKLKEIRDILSDLPVKVLSKKALNLEEFEIKEDGNSLEENSIKKAQALAKLTDHMVMADDSGLFVEALDGKPGIHSSRYAGEEGNDEKNNQELLNALEGLPMEKRKAEFKTVIALVTDKRELITIEGSCSGHIAFKPKGDNDFGYDPLFIPTGYDKTFAQLDPKIKNKISHRADAIRKLKEILEDLLKDD